MKISGYFRSGLCLLPIVGGMVDFYFWATYKKKKAATERVDANASSENSKPSSSPTLSNSPSNSTNPSSRQERSSSSDSDESDYSLMEDTEKSPKYDAGWRLDIPDPDDPSLSDGGWVRVSPKRNLEESPKAPQEPPLPRDSNPSDVRATDEDPKSNKFGVKCAYFVACLIPFGRLAISYLVVKNQCTGISFGGKLKAFLNIYLFGTKTWLETHGLFAQGKQPIPSSQPTDQLKQGPLDYTKYFRS